MQGYNGKRNCPFFQWNDQRCAQRFNLRRLHEVFDECLGDFALCGIYRWLSARHQGRERRPCECRVAS